VEKNQHIKEFKKFDKMQKWKKYFWAFCTLLFTVIAIVIWWKGMVFWSKSMGTYD
jgi:cytoskeletal protein RodZ